MTDIGLTVEDADGSDAAVLVVDGEVDLSTAPRLREKLIELVTAGRQLIVIDLDRVGFLDSTGLGVLVGGLKRARTHNGDIAIVCTQRRILKVFEITGLTTVFAIHATVADALSAEPPSRAAGE